MTMLAKVYHIIDWTELWVILGAVLAGMIWKSALIIAPLAGLGFVLLHLIVERRLPGPTPAAPAILLLAFLLPLNYAYSAIPVLTLQPILRILGGIALYYAVIHWCQSAGRLRWLVIFTGLAALLLSFLSAVAVQWTDGKLFFIPSSMYERFAVLVRDDIHPNVLAGSLIAIMPLTLAVPLIGWKKLTWVERIVYLIVFISAAAALVLTQSRGAILALMLVLGVVFLLRSRWFWLLPLLGGLSVGAAWFTVGKSELTWLAADLVSAKGLGQRTDIWQRALFMLQDFPLTGVGLGHFSEAFRIFYPITLDPTSYMPHAHNLFLQVGVDLGIPGLVLWLSILLASLAAAWRVYRQGKADQQELISAIGVGLLGCQLAIILHGMFDSVLWGEIRIAPLVWWIWGLSIAALNVANKSAVIDPRKYINPDLGRTMTTGESINSR